MRLIECVVISLALIVTACGQAVDEPRERSQPIGAFGLEEAARPDRRAEELARRRAEEEARLSRVEALWAARVERARTLAVQASVSDDMTQCDVAVAPRRSAGDANVDRLLAVSEQALVVFVIPGLAWSEESGRFPVARVRSDFSSFAGLALEQSSANAVCYVSWHSLDGFSGSSNARLATTLAAVRELAADPLIASTEKKRIVLIGYSQGGNLAKQAAVQEIARDGAPYPRLRVVTLATPHNGTALSEAAAGVAQIVSAFAAIGAALSNDQDALEAASQGFEMSSRYRDSQAYEEMVPGNARLAALNNQFGEVVARLDFVNVLSTSDTVVPLQSARWNDNYDVPISGLSHADFTELAGGGSLRGAVERFLSPQLLAGEAPDPGPDPELDPTPRFDEIAREVEAKYQSSTRRLLVAE